MIEFHKRRVGDVTIIDLEGLLGPEVKESLLSCLDELAPHPPIKLVLNLKKVDMIHTIGLGVLIGLYKSIEAQHGFLKFTELSADVYELFVITQLMKIFDIYEHEKDALASF